MHSENENIGLFDLDGSLANYDKAMLAGLESLRAPGEAPIDDLWDLERFPHLEARKTIISSMPGFWMSLEPIPKGFKILNMAIELGFRVVVLTQTPKTKPIAAQEKIMWIQKHLGDVDFELTRDKGLVYGRFLYDDYAPYMTKWLKHRPRGLGIMPEHEYNKNFNHPQLIKHTDSPESLDQIRKALIAVRDRKPWQQIP